MSTQRRTSLIALCIVATSLFIGCVVTGAPNIAQHRWWSGLGPVLPHDNFPADCSMCHVGDDWSSLTDDFTFDHEAETGYPLAGAHERAQCLRCHNDRGPVTVFEAKGCIGCHEDFHSGDLGTRCETCHTQNTWKATDMIAWHNRTRFPLTGVHTMTACFRCHPGALVGQFVPADVECVTCHTEDLLATNNPPHIPLGWVDRCDRCHVPTVWQQAEISN